MMIAFQRSSASKLTAILSLTVVMYSHAKATEKEPNFLIVGPGVTPEYQGSDDYTVVPFFVSQTYVYNRYVEIEGLTGQIALTNAWEWQYGAAVRLDFGRESDVKNKQVAQLEAIDTSVSLGLFTSRGAEDVFIVGDGLTLKMTLAKDISGTHGGTQLDISFDYELPLMIPFLFGFELATTLADDDYMATYFGIDTYNAAITGLPEYKASSGFRDVSLSANTGFFLTPQWGVFGRLSVSQLLDDAKNSPITKIGNSQSYFAGIGLLYRFEEQL